MRVSSYLLLALLVPALLAARRGTPADAEALVRAGNAAFERGAYAEAVRLYERAEAISTDPRLVAFNLATARYQLAQEGDLRALPAAEEAYRCCLEAGDPRRARALYGLGNCLLIRASTTRVLDAAALRAAIDRFTLCLRDPGCDADLAADARYNQGRARLLLLQAPPAPGGGEEPSSGADSEKDDTDDPGRKNDARGEDGMGGDGHPDRATPVGPGGSDVGARPEGKPTPGRGALPPVPDRPDAAPLSAPDAAEHLEQAAKKIREELTAHRRARARPVSPGVRDW
jgi:tetratricopeptide (TPR) repeat protein